MREGVTGIGIYGKGILEALYSGGDLTVAQITQMTSGYASASAYIRRLKSSGPNKTVLEISVGTVAAVAFAPCSLLV